MERALESDPYAEAISRFDAVRVLESELPLHHRCRSTLMTHGAQAEFSAVYFHGFTSCPAQGHSLASRLHERGFNIYMPRMFGHGGLDPARFPMAGLSAHSLVAMAEESIDIAAGLGRTVFVIGLSAGGTIASWVAQNRSDVARVVAVSPFFAPFKVPQQAVTQASRMLLKMPNMVIKWNPLANVATEDVDYPFALPATHALAEIMLLGQQVLAQAKASPPAAGNIGVLLNEADRTVSNLATSELVEAWRARRARLSVEVLPQAYRLPHDLINPFEKGNDFERVYQALLGMLGMSER